MMDNNTLIEMARLITIQQAEIDRLKTLLPSNKKSKSKLNSETKERRLSLITKMYQKHWKKILVENAEQIAHINQQLLASELSIFKPQLEFREILRPFK